MRGFHTDVMSARATCEVQAMLQVAQSRRPYSGGRPLGGSPMPKEVLGSKPGTAQSQRSNFSADGMQMVAAEYVLDFGHVIKGTQKVSGLPFKLSCCAPCANCCMKGYEHLTNVETCFYCPQTFLSEISSVGMTFLSQNRHFAVEKSCQVSHGF